jgi:hypothetical protein
MSVLFDRVTVELTRVSCWCGVVFAIPKNAWDEKMRQRDLGQRVELHCPVNGHSMSWDGGDALKKAQDAVVRERQRREQAEADARYNRDRANREERRVRAARGLVTRIKNKVAKGRCPCCSHLFKDLRSHMAKEHPGFDPSKGIDAIAVKGTPGARP